MLLVSCSASSSSGSETALVTERNAALDRAIASGNLDSIMVFYADDAVLLPAAEPVINGKAAIREEWKHILAIPDFQTKSSLTKVEVANNGDMAYTMGSYRTIMMGEDGKQVTEPGKYLSIWKKKPGGAWLIAVETYNTDIPPPDHK